jgi:hypothetical protein
MERRPGLEACSDYKTEAALCVERSDISFCDVREGTVRIEVTVHNVGEQRSRPTPMRLESAPLGAFVPWQPLTQLMVPPLEPGESRALSVDVARPQEAPLGDFDRLPPKRLLTAISSPDQPNQDARGGLADVLNLLRRKPSRPASGGRASGKATLASDLFDLTNREHPYWAGNINVFVGKRAVERHRAMALRIYPGRTNLAMFVVGSPGIPDAYAFDLVGLAEDWKANLYDMRGAHSFAIDSSCNPLKQSQWVELDGTTMMVLAICPPAGCQSGKLEVHVTRRSCGKEAVVEFDLDPSAKGAGCYSL